MVTVFGCCCPSRLYNVLLLQQPSDWWGEWHSRTFDIKWYWLCHTLSHMTNVAKMSKPRKSAGFRKPNKIDMSYCNVTWMFDFHCAEWCMSRVWRQKAVFIFICWQCFFCANLKSQLNTCKYEHDFVRSSMQLKHAMWKLLNLQQTHTENVWSKIFCI